MRDHRRSQRPVALNARSPRQMDRSRWSGARSALPRPERETIKTHHLAWGLVVFAGALAMARADDARPAPTVLPVQVGEWVIQKDTNPNAPTAYLYMWVSKIEGKKITVMSQMLHADLETAVMPPVARTVDTLGVVREDLAKLAKCPEEELTVGGAKFRCWKMGNKTSCHWVSASVPIYGAVQFVTLDAQGEELARSELVAYGLTGAKAKPLRAKAAK
jgi:hypothetical protein